MMFSITGQEKGDLAFNTGDCMSRFECICISHYIYNYMEKIKLPNTDNDWLHTYTLRQV